MNFKGKFEKAPNSIDFAFGTFGKSLDFRLISLTAKSMSKCSFSAVNSVIIDNGPLRLVRDPKSKCDSSAIYELLIELKEPARLAVWSIQEGVLDANNFQAIAGDKLFLFGSAVVPSYFSPSSRLFMLFKLWKIPLPYFAFCVFTWVLIFFPLSLAMLKIHTKFRSRTAFASALPSYACILLLWTYLNPPLQAPDEPDHVWTFFNTWKDNSAGKAAVEDLQAWANELHFARIVFQPQQHFNPSDLAQKQEASFPTFVTPVDLNSRSRTQDIYYWIVKGLVKSDSTSSAFWTLILRIGNALLNIGLLAIALKLIRVKERPFGSETVWLFFLCGAWGVFSLHVSNHSLMASLFSAFAIVCVFSKTRNLREEFSSAIFLGNIFSWLVLAGPVGIVCTPFLLFYRFLSRNWLNLNEKELILRHQKTGIFWLVFCFITSSIFAFFGGSYLDNLLSRAGFAGLSSTNHLHLILVIFAIGLALGLLEAAVVLLVSPKFSVSKFLRGVLNSASFNRILFVFFSIFLVFQFVAPNLLKIKPLADIEIPGVMSGFVYAKYAVVRFLFSLGGLAPDFYISSSFWSGFGWLDSIFCLTLLWLLKSLPGAPLFLYVLGLGRTISPKNMMIWLAGIVTALAMVGLLANQVAKISVNLHGRYLIFPYVTITLFGYFPLRKIKCLAANLGPLIIVLQFYCLIFVLIRYFQ